MVSGELTARTAEQFRTEIKTALGETDILVLDLMDLDYVASAGLRVFLEAKKLMDIKRGKLILRKVSPAVMDVFEITGFSDILHIE